LCFASRWSDGEPVLSEELDEARWIDPAELATLPTTAGLADIVADAFERLAKPPSP
jgi:NADH pyrophosphatase NudC (nudix superfamily)